MAREQKPRAFAKEVDLEPRVGKLRTVRGPADAARVLLREWPESARLCARRAAAMKAVLETLRRQRPPSHARRALVSAARAAGILAAETSDEPAGGSGHEWKQAAE